MSKSRTVWDDPAFVARWNETYGLDMSGAKARTDMLFPLFRDRAGDLSGKTLVDLGCGNGNLIKVFQQEAFARWTGIDNGAAIIKSAAESVNDPRVVFTDEDISGPLALEKHSADIVTVFFVMEDLPNDRLDGLFANVHDALKPGGTAMLFFNHPAYAQHHDELARGGVNEKFPGHRGYFDRTAVPFSLGNLNQAQGYGVTPLYHHKTLADLMNSAARAGLAVTHMIEVPSSVATYAELASAPPKQGDYPRFLYLELGAR